MRRIVECAVERQVAELTLFAFSSDNWQRPLGETTVLMALFQEYLRQEVRTCLEQGIALEVIGRRDRLGRALRGAIDAAEAATAEGDRMRLRIAVDYSSRESVERLASGGAVANRPSIPGRPPSEKSHDASHLRDRLAALVHARQPISDVDLLIRSGGERRLSDFLLLECAYAELHFTDVLWPDFTAQDFADAIEAFALRNRRFGRLGDAPATAKASRVHRAR